METPPELQSMLDGEHGPTKQKAARLVVDLAASAGASEFTRCAHAHVSGVSVITGGHGSVSYTHLTLPTILRV